MELLLDTANLEAIGKYSDYYNIIGVTTNPSIISKENTEFWGLVKEIRSIIGKDKMLHVQTVQTTAEKMIEEAKLLKNLMESGMVKTCIFVTHRPAGKDLCSRSYSIREGIVREEK